MLLLEPREDFDKCIVGVNHNNTRAIYNVDKVIETFMDLNECSFEIAREDFEYNILRSLPYYEDSPIFIKTDFCLDDY